LATLLGENYRSSEYAIKELIDNAWDADADTVWISLPEPLSQEPVVIQDNGSGMTEKEVLNEYLRVASSRKSRKGEKTSLKNRKVKGRKGIGKFAGLLAANLMILETTARGIKTRLELDKESLLNAPKSQSDLEAIVLPHKTEKADSLKQGTTITLFGLNQSWLFLILKDLNKF
jgi:HSP90 family molecular chaperone